MKTFSIQAYVTGIQEQSYYDRKRGPFGDPAVEVRIRGAVLILTLAIPGAEGVSRLEVPIPAGPGPEWERHLLSPAFDPRRQPILLTMGIPESEDPAT